MSIEENKVLEMSEGERYIRFCIATQEHRKAGYEFNQEHVDMLAALFKVQAPRLPEAPKTITPKVPTYRSSTEGF